MDKMTFAQARQKLTEVSGGKYRSVSFEITEKDGRIIGTKCRVYIDGQSGHTAETFEKAFDSLDNYMNPKIITENDILNMEPGGLL
jgi:hypothetical protein